LLVRGLFDLFFSSTSKEQQTEASPQGRGQRSGWQGEQEGWNWISFSRWFASQRLKTRIAKMADGSFALEVFVDGMTCKYAPHSLLSFLSSVAPINPLMQLHVQK